MMEHHTSVSKCRNSSRNAWSSWTLLWFTSSFVGAIFAFYYLLPAFSNHQLSFHQQQVAVISSPCQADRKIIILYWTKYYVTTDFGFGMGRVPFVGCATNEFSDRGGCLTTTDRSLLNVSDAILFHARNLNTSDLPPPRWRRPRQHFIFFLYESPVNTNLGMLRQPLFKNYFNRTMTYRRDSDIIDLLPYGRMQCIDAASPSCSDFPRTANDKTVKDNYNTTSIHVKIDLTLKNRAVAWFVSHCKTNSRRELLVRSLSQFIQVDTYGRCGRNNCSSADECDQILSRHYRFYISFENSLCLDYVTEKLYRPLQHNTVPVVYGGANYSLYLPAGSYVNAMDFENPEHLANYLSKLMVDDELYLSYFRWKAKYVVNRQPTDGICQLCHLLSDAKTKEKSYPDIAEWWAGDSTHQVCRSPPATLV